MSLLDFFKRWWKRREAQRIAVESDDYLILVKATGAEVEVTPYGGGFQEQELLIEAHRVEVIDKDDL